MSKKQGRAAYNDDDLDDDYDEDYYDEEEDSYGDAEQLNSTYDAVADVVGEAFDEEQIVKALRSCSYNVAKAVDHLLSPPQKAAGGASSSNKKGGPAVVATPKQSQPAPAAKSTPASAAAASSKATTAAAGWGSPAAAASNAAKSSATATATAASSTPQTSLSRAPTTSSTGPSATAAAAGGSAEPLPLPAVPEEIRRHYAQEDKCEGGLKPRLSVVTIGHVDAGKSTLMGHLLFDLGVVSARQLHRYAKEAREMGKASFAFAWVLDEEGSERERGVTMDVGTNAFETSSRSFTLLDAPGHRDFVPSTITAIAQADVALLVLDASPGEFEMSLLGGQGQGGGGSGGQAGQAKEHALLARSFGITQLVVAVNKMDGPRVQWSQQRFESIKEQATPVLVGMGYKKENITFVPVSGLTGINLVKSGEECRRHAAEAEAANGGDAGAGAAGFSSAATASLRAASSATGSSSGFSRSSSDGAPPPGATSPPLTTSWPGLSSSSSPALSPSKRAVKPPREGFDDAEAGGDDDSDEEERRRRREREREREAEAFGDMLEGLGFSSASSASSSSSSTTTTTAPPAAGSAGLSRQPTSAGSSGSASLPTSPTARMANGGADALAVERDIAAMLFNPEALKSSEIARLTAWYGEDKPTLIRALENARPPPRLIDKPLRLCVSDVYRAGAGGGGGGPAGGGITVAGRIEGGWVQAHSTKVMIVPGGETASIKAIMINGRQVPFAAAGDNVDLLLGGLEHNEAAVASLRPGSILCWPSHPIRMVTKFKAQIATFPGLDMPIVPGQQLMFHAHTLEEPCNITKLLRTLDRDGHTKAIKPRSLGRNSVAVVRVALTRPVCAETFAEHKRLGRFMLRYGGQTVAAGMVLKIKR